MINSSDSSSFISKIWQFRKKIRTEAVVPFGVFSAVVILYFTLFFDLHLRKTIEYFYTDLNGAEVNIDSVQTRFLRGSFRLWNLQVTNPEDPMKNRYQISEINFKFSWDALLRGKYVIDLASIEGIQLNSPRSAPGKLKTDSYTGFVAGKTKELFDQKTLQNAASFLEGADPKFDVEQATDLKTLKQIEALEASLTEQEKQWKNQMESLPTEEEISGLVNRASSIDISGTNDPRVLASRIGELKQVTQELDSKVATIQQTSELVNNGVKSYRQSLGTIEKSIEEDQKELENVMKLPRLDTDTITRQLFGQIFGSRVGEMEKYLATARKNLPPKKEGEEEGDRKAKKEESELDSRGLFEGRNYHFGKKNAYPLFWLKKAEISSSSRDSEYSGDVVGEIVNATSDQKVIDRATVLKFRGNFARQKISNLGLNIRLDHTGETPDESFELSVGAYPVENVNLIQSDSVQFGLTEAVGSLQTVGRFRGPELRVTSDHKFQKVKYNVNAQSKPLDSLLKQTAKQMKVVVAQAEVTGTWSSPKFSFKSNIGHAIAKGFDRQLDEKLASARQQVRDHVEQKVAKKRDQLTSRFNKINSGIRSKLGSRMDKITKVKGLADSKIAEANNKIAAGTKQKAVNSVKKRFGL